MPFRLSRQMFYILAAVCMCTWIYITHQVINSGVDEKNLKSAVHTGHTLGISSSLGNEKLKWIKEKEQYIWNGNIKEKRGEMDMAGDNRKTESTEYDDIPFNQNELKIIDTDKKGVTVDKGRKNVYGEELIKEDSEDYEVDRAAKYIHDDQERHANVNDDGEDNNEESEDDVGDDNDYEEISVVKVDGNNEYMFDAMHKRNKMILPKNKDRVNDRNLDFQNVHTNNIPVAQKDNFTDKLVNKQGNGKSINEIKDHTNVKRGVQPFAKYKDIEGDKAEANQSDILNDDGTDPESEKEALEERENTDGFDRDETNHRHNVGNQVKETVENKTNFVNMSNVVNLNEVKTEKDEKQNQSKNVKQDNVSQGRREAKDSFRILQNKLVGVVAERIVWKAQGKQLVFG